MAPIAIALAVAGLAAALVLFSVDTGDAADAPPVPVARPSPPIVTVRPTTPPAPVAAVVSSEPDPAALEAVASFERFARMVNLGDSEAVMALMVSEPIPPAVSRLAEWPHLPTDAGWWSDGGLDAERVRGFVRYIFTIPGSVFLSECRGTTHARSHRLASVTCSYETVGGPLQVLGQDIERGHLHATMLDGLVAGVERHGSIDRDLWARLADWTAERYPDRYLASLGTHGSSLIFDPVYTGNSALEHVGLATEMAADR